MKKTWFYILMAALQALVSCSDDTLGDMKGYPVLNASYLGVRKDNYDCSMSSGNFNLHIDAVNAPWQISNGVSWLLPSPLTGITDADVNVSYTGNPIADTRIGVFYVNSTISNYSKSVPVTVTQAAAYATLEVETSDVTLPANGESQSITITTNSPTWYAECTNTSNTWLNFTKSEGALIISASENTHQYDRSAIIHVYKAKGSGNYVSVYVTQKASSISASTETLLFEQPGADVKLSLTSDVAWQAHTYVTWAEVSPQEGQAGKCELNISVAPNTTDYERTCNVYLKGKDEAHSRIAIPIKQKGYYITTNVNRVNDQPPTNNDYDIKVQSNTEWEVKACPDWITPGQLKGEGNATLPLKISANSSTSSRKGTITIGRVGSSLQTDVTVQQNGVWLSTGKGVLSFDDHSGTQALVIKSNGDWSAETSNDWLHLSPNSGQGRDTLYVTADENLEKGIRNGQINVIYGDKVEYIQVSQSCKYIDASNYENALPSRGGSIDATITTNQQWRANVVDTQATWLQLSPIEGSGDAHLLITAADNPSVNSRRASVKVATNYDNYWVAFDVLQAARYLRVGVDALLFFSRGGVSDLVTIETDGEIKITSDQAWLTTERSPDGNSFVAIAQPNDGNEPRKATITLELTDLVEGTYKLLLPVTQLNQGGNFTRTHYGTDQNYNDHGNTQAGVSIIGWGDDKNFNGDSPYQLHLTKNGYGNEHNYNESGVSNFTLTLTNYAADSNWDNETASRLTVVRTGYKNDANYDGHDTTNGNVSKGNYGEDKDRNSTSTTNGNVSKGNYGEDKDRNSTSTTNGNVSKGNYGEDKDRNSTSTTNGNVSKRGYKNENNWDD